uniref:Uncharacterized protein n=1 Tax=Micromonas pusilla TaxID=38833 RepID=A0A7R9XY63_MICPS
MTYRSQMSVVRGHVLLQRIACRRWSDALSHLKMSYVWLHKRDKLTLATRRSSFVRKIRASSRYLVLQKVAMQLSSQTDSGQHLKRHRRSMRLLRLISKLL